MSILELQLRAYLHCATVHTKLQNFLYMLIEGVHTIQNGAYERNGFIACFVGGHKIVLNWMTVITDLLHFFVVSVKFGSCITRSSIVFLII